MAEYTTPVNQFLKSIDIQPYDRYLPNAFNDSLTVLEKVNKVIYQLNESNQLTNEVVEKWNEFANWINAGGINQPIDEKINELLENDTLKNLIDTEVMTEFKQEITQATNSQVSNVTRQLSTVQQEQENTKIRTATPKTLKPIITFQFDDGYIYDRTLLKPIFDKHGVKFSMALVPNIIKGNDNRYMRLNECLVMYNQGFEVLSHTMNHLELGKLTDEQQEYELGESKKQLEEMGFGKIESIIYPFGSYNAKTLEIARKYYRSGDTVNGGINTSPIDTYKILRHGLAASGANKTLAQYKSIVDNAVATNGWIVFYSHGIEYQNDPSQLQLLDELIAYIKSLNIDIVPVKQAIDLFENKIDIGIKDTERFKVGADGKVDSSFLNPYLKQNVSTKKYTNTSPITEFPKGEITVSTHGIADNTGFPLASGSGILTTYRIFTTDDLSMQLFYPLNGTQFLKRIWNVTNQTWGAWSIYEQNRHTRGSVEVDAGVINASSFKTLTIPFTGAVPTRSVVVTPAYGIANDILWNVLCDTNDTIKIRLYNPTSSPITVGNRTWAVTLTNIS